MLLYTEKAGSFPMSRRECALLCSEEEYSFLLTSREYPRFFLFREEADSFSRERRECLASIQKGGTLLLGTEEEVAPVLFYSQRRRTPSLERGESVSILYREEADSFSMRRREWFPFSSMQRGGRIHFMTRRECLDSVLKGGRLLPYE